MTIDELNAVAAGYAQEFELKPAPHFELECGLASELECGLASAVAHFEDPSDDEDFTECLCGWLSMHGLKYDCDYNCDCGCIELTVFGVEL